MFGNFQVDIYMITHPHCTDRATRFFRLLATLINVRTEQASVRIKCSFSKRRAYTFNRIVAIKAVLRGLTLSEHIF